ncbi:hypothetical protein F511_24978 [Dorcoceras hygrometricum]|uniref:Uncharacterized protein n=1 Tax=Dorcoceras hygrometricum TaxID=472368 RepID=A0A2Z7AMY0_9LAMI|nr:hypothetical protein F511_24978 [Dorcoceras hygrometricum]
MGSNPSTESNYKTTVNSKNKMQMLCMRKETTAQRILQQKHVATLTTRRIGEMRVRNHSSPSHPGKKTEKQQRTKAAIAEWNAWIQLAVGPQPLWLRNHNSELAHRIMVKRLATSPHDPLGITDSACKNQLVVVSVQYGPFNPYIPIRSTTIGKSRVAIDPIAMHTSWRSNSDIASVTSIGYPRMSASGESSTTMHRLLHASGSHPIPTPYEPKNETPSSACTRRTDEISTNGFSSLNWPETIFRRRRAAAAAATA